jgi:hypothetical protein
MENSDLNMDLTESQPLERGVVPPARTPVENKAPAYRQTRLWTWARQSRIGELTRAWRACRREFWALAKCPQANYPSVGQLAESIAALRACSAEPSDADNETEAPIFLLSTGWRAGSTLLQRILVTDPRLLLWGEPLGEMTVASRLAEMVGHFISPRNLELWKSQGDPTSPALSTSWVANLYPPSKDFRLALRSLFDQWLGVPAHKRGFARWGLKEVRLGATEASFLHWLYPCAKFVIISRHPYDCYRSLADSHWDQVYDKHPDVPVDSAASFAKHWNRLAISWSELPKGFPSFHIKYEELISGAVDFRRLESWLGIEIRESVALSVSVGSTAKRTHLSWYERLIIAHEAKIGMHALGYTT